MKRVICLMLSVVFIVSILLIPAVAVGTDYLNDTPYVYPIKPGTDEWKTLNGVIEKRQACYVSEETLSSMTTKALVETVVTYPLFADIYAYNSIDLGINMLGTYFAGVKVLLERADATTWLRWYSAKEELREEYTDISYFNSDVLITYVESKQTIAEKQIVRISNGKYSSVFVYAEVDNDDSISNRSLTPGSPIYTPNGTEVPAYLPDGIGLNRIYGLSWSDHNTTYQAAKADNIALQNIYTSAVQNIGINPSYNCHSYAWYSQAANSYWINDPCVYVLDQSYTATSVVAVGEKVTYMSSSSALIHSGVVNSAGSALTPIRIASKWGYLGMYIHDYNDCPYYGTDVTLYYFE